MRMSYLQCPIVAPPAGSSGCASSADGAKPAAARISVQTLLRIRISMSGGNPVVSLKLALKALRDTYPGWGKHAERTFGSAHSAREVRVGAMLPLANKAH